MTFPFYPKGLPGGASVPLQGNPTSQWTIAFTFRHRTRPGKGIMFPAMLIAAIEPPLRYETDRSLGKEGR